MASSHNSSKSCRQCHEKEKNIKVLEDKIDVVQRSFRGVVAAIKKSQLELQNKDKLINELSKKSHCSDPEQQVRLIELENTVTELSKVIGSCEIEKFKDKQVIQTLTSELEELAQKLISLQCNEDSPLTSSRPAILFRNRQVQTESEASVSSVTVDVETQTVGDIPEGQRSLSKKAELAIVIPTHRPPNVILDVNSLVSAPEPERRRSDSSMSGQSHSTFVSEIDCKEIELVEARLKSRELEVALREIEWKYKMERLRLEAKVSNLERENQNLVKDKTFQPNLIYVRNVLAKFIKTEDKSQKRIMMNALLTALDVQERI